MKDLRRYLFDAYIKFMCDCGLTIHLVVDATYDRVSVPQAYVNEHGVIVLNLTPGAIEEFWIMDSGLQFMARFNKVPTKVFIPYGAMKMLFDPSRTGGYATAFDLSDWFQHDGVRPEVKPEVPVKEEKKKPSFLSVVK